MIMVNEYLFLTPTTTTSCTVPTKTLAPLERPRHYSSAARKKLQLRGT